ncbi:MAG: NAD(P)-dependent oxidoreductase [Enterobacteriaceae bacterium]
MKKNKILIDKSVFLGKKIFSKIEENDVIVKKNVSNVDLSKIHTLITKSNFRIDKNLIRNSKIKFIGSATSGVDHVDIDFLKKKNIFFASATGSNSKSVVEYVFTSLLYLSEKHNFFLKDKVVGILGVGNIGLSLRNKLRDFGIQTMIFDPLNKKIKKFDDCFPFEKIISDSDIITLHTPLTYTKDYPTYHMIDKYVLDSIKENSILINTSRGSVVDNFSLLKILKNKKKMFVVLDVWENEPNISCDLLNFVEIGTPHIAGHSLEGKLSGTINIFKKYSNFIKKKVFFRFKKNLPKFWINKIEINKKFDQKLFYNLSKLFFNINEYNMKLNNKNFIKLRNSHIRREWSSLSIRVYDCFTKKTLVKLGFKCRNN